MVIVLRRCDTWVKSACFSATSDHLLNTNKSLHDKLYSQLERYTSLLFASRGLMSVRTTALYEYASAFSEGKIVGFSFPFFWDHAQVSVLLPRRR